MSVVMVEQICECFVVVLVLSELEVFDEGYKYVGYVNVGKGYFYVCIVSGVFVGVLLIKWYCMVYVVLDGLMDQGIYVLFIDV